MLAYLEMVLTAFIFIAIGAISVELIAVKLGLLPGVKLPWDD